MTVTTGGRGWSSAFGIVHAPDSDLDIGIADALDVVAVLGDHQLRRIGVERLVDGRHDAHTHQGLDDIGTSLRHPAREFPEP